MVKKLMAWLALAALATVIYATPSASQTLKTINLTWRTLASGAFIDSSAFLETGASNATRDTSVAFVANIAQSRSSVTGLADSSLWMRVELHASDTYQTGVLPSASGRSDSLYLTIEGSEDGQNWSKLTNMTDFLVLPVTDNAASTLYAFTVGISWGRANAPAHLNSGRRLYRIIPRGDLGGSWVGSVSFYQ